MYICEGGQTGIDIGTKSECEEAAATLSLNDTAHPPLSDAYPRGCYFEAPYLGSMLLVKNTHAPPLGLASARLDVSAITLMALL